MPKYNVKEPVKFGADRFEEGDEVEMDAKLAKPHVTSGVLEPQGAKGKKDGAGDGTNS